MIKKSGGKKNILSYALIIILAIAIIMVGSQFAGSLYQGYFKMRVNTNTSSIITRNEVSVPLVRQVRYPVPDISMTENFEAMALKSSIKKIDPVLPKLTLVCRPTHNFNFQVVIDPDTTPQSLDKIKTIMTNVSNDLCNRSGVGIKVSEYKYLPAGSIQKFTPYSVSSGDTTYFLNNFFDEYLYQIGSSRPDLNGVTFFSAQEPNAHAYGGLNIPRFSPNYTNSVPNAYFISDKIYGMIIDPTHKFGACGYDSTQTKIISTLSSGGECANQQGTQCTIKFGYSICSNLTDSYLASTDTKFMEFVVGHELLHNFGFQGNFDHVSDSTICKSINVPEFSKLPGASCSGDDVQCWNNICKYAWGIMLSRVTDTNKTPNSPVPVFPVGVTIPKDWANVTFAWKPSIGAEGYSVQIIDAEKASSGQPATVGFYCQFTQKNVCEIGTNQLSHGKYYNWSVLKKQGTNLTTGPAYRFYFE